MKTLLRSEELALMAFAVAALYLGPVHLQWFWWPLLFLAPDVSMLGYLAGPRTGAFCYNLFHHKLSALAVMALGWFLHNDGLLTAGLILLAHSAFDRVLGYGLKYPDAFKHTHLDIFHTEKTGASAA